MTPTAELLIPEVEDLVKSQRYGELREALHLVHPADIADILGGIEPADAAVVFRILQRDDAAQVFSYMPGETQERVIGTLGTDQVVGVIERMTPDDRAHLLDELPEDVAQRVVASLSPETRKETQAILGYEPRTVGRLMTPDYVSVRPGWTVGEALAHIRKHGKDAETINVVYVVDNEGRLIDDMRLRSLLLAEPTARIEDLMNRSFVTLRGDQPQEDAVALMARYDRTALPVTDTRGVLIGIVTADDVADVAQREATEDIQKMGGVGALEEPYMRAGHVEMYKKRGVWLAALFVGQTITILVLGGFQDKIAEATVLTLFMPLVMSCGGNSGSQAATLVTRAIALGEIAHADWLRVIRKEFVSASMLGGTLAGMGLACVEFFRLVGLLKITPTQGHYLALSVSAAIFSVVMWGTTLGSLLPLILRRVGIDPATASSPMVATLMDASGTLIYFGIALAILTGVII